MSQQTGYRIISGYAFNSKNHGRRNELLDERQGNKNRNKEFKNTNDIQYAAERHLSIAPSNIRMNQTNIKYVDNSNRILHKITQAAISKLSSFDGSNPQNLSQSSYKSFSDTIKRCNDKDGLQNLGNTCFLNSVIQLLYSAQTYRNLISWPNRSYKPAQFDIVKYLKMIFVSLCKAKQEKGGELEKYLKKRKENMQLFVRYLQASHPCYKPRSQQDAFAFLMYILDNCFISLQKSADLFRVEYSTSCKCSKSNLRFKEYHVDKENAMCRKCNREVVLKYFACPQYLIVLAKNTNHNKQFMQLETHEGGIVKYQFLSAISYLGSGLSGHYISFRKNQDENRQNYKWLIIDDSTVTQTKQLQLESRKFNIILYEKKIEGKKTDRQEKTEEKKENVNDSHLNKNVRLQRINSMISSKIVPLNSKIQQNVIYGAQIQLVSKVIRLGKEIYKEKQKADIYFTLQKLKKNVKNAKMSFMLCLSDKNYSIIVLNKQNFFELKQQHIRYTQSFLTQILKWIQEAYTKAYINKFKECDEKEDEDFYESYEMLKKNIFDIGSLDTNKKIVVVANSRMSHLSVAPR